MYIDNPYYKEALDNDNKQLKSEIQIGENIILSNSDIKDIKYDLDINPNGKFCIGGVHSATVGFNMLNYYGIYDNTNFENKEFIINLKISLKDLYTVEKFNKEKIKKINKVQVKQLTSLWIPIGKFYVTEIKKNENKTISIKLIDKTKFLESEYKSNLTYPTTLKRIYNEIHTLVGIKAINTEFVNNDLTINNKPTGYTYKQILGNIAECAGGFYIINRIGEGEIRYYSNNINKTVEKGKYKEFIPSENYITIKKIKWLDTVIGEDTGHMLELDEKNIFLNDSALQNILNKIRNFTYIPYTYKTNRGDFAQDCGDKISVTDTKAVDFTSFIFRNSWTFNGMISQECSASGETTIENTYSTKGPVTQAINRIENNLIPSTLEQAINAATELLTQFNGGYVVKKDGELYICDNVDIDKAVRLWRWNINGLGYSGSGIKGPYALAMTMDGSINASFITSGIMTANRIQGGTLKIGGINNTNGSIAVVDSNGNDLVTIDVRGIVMANGTKLIGGNGVLSNFKYDTGDWQELGFFGEWMNISRKKNIKISAYIPTNFEIISAFVTLYHAPRYLRGLSDNTDLSNGFDAWCYSRSIKLYSTSEVKDYYRAGNYASEELEEDISYNEIYNAFGDTGFTGKCPTIPPGQNLKNTVNNITSIDLKESFNPGNYNYFKIETAENMPSRISEYYTHTGLAMATLNVIGYMK